MDAEGLLQSKQSIDEEALAELEALREKPEMLLKCVEESVTANVRSVFFLSNLSTGLLKGEVKHYQTN